MGRQCLPFSGCIIPVLICLDQWVITYSDRELLCDIQTRKILFLSYKYWMEKLTIEICTNVLSQIILSQLQKLFVLKNFCQERGNFEFHRKSEHGCTHRWLYVWILRENL